MPGILGGLMAFAASNIWFHDFAALALPGLPARGLMPDFFSFLQIDVYVGAGSGYAGMLTGRNLARLQDPQADEAPRIFLLYAFLLGTGLALLVNVILLIMMLL